MMRIALPIMAFAMLAAPMIGASLADQARTAQPQPVVQEASVAISRAQAIDIAAAQGLLEVSAITLSNGAWRIEGEAYGGRILQVGVSARTGGVHVLDLGVEI